MASTRTRKRRQQRQRAKQRETYVQSPFDKMWKDLYLPIFVEQLNNTMVFMKHLDDDIPISCGGKSFTVPISYHETKS